ncbi:MAG: hypothetical protein IKS51_01365, partial [Erysipelotrichaceae bacterium]|nr:hypothetical protein [Erysipelotrichaceae bacterium]
MKKPSFNRIMTLLLAVTMLFSGMTMSAAKAESSSTWEKVSDIQAAAASGKSVAITMTASDGTVYALPTAKSSSAGPSAVTATKSSNILQINDTEEAFGWTIASSGNGYTISSGTNYLYVTNNNNGVRVNSMPNTGYVWSITSNYLTAVDPGSNTRYLGIYTSTPNWRCYTSINSNIQNQTLEFWTIKESSGSEPEPAIAQLNQFTTAPENGSQLVIYYPEDSMALTTTASGSKLAGVAATVENGKLNQTASMAYLTVVLDSNENYQFKDENGRFLTSGATGSSLSFQATATDYSLWTLQQQSDGTWFVPNVNAVHSNGSQQYLEYYSGFTTYGYKEDSSSQYKFAFYGVHGSGGPVTPETYTVTVNPSEHGSVSVNKNEVQDGGQVVITVAPEEGYELDKLLVNGVDTAVTNNTATVTVHSNLIISATFKKASTPAPAGSVYEQITDLSDLEDGDQIVIVNLANSIALSQIYSGYYNSGVAVTVNDGTIANPGADIIWTVGVTTQADGTKIYTFSTAEGQKLSMAASRTSMPLGD